MRPITNWKCQNNDMIDYRLFCRGEPVLHYENISMGIWMSRDCTQKDYLSSSDLKNEWNLDACPHFTVIGIELKNAHYSATQSILWLSSWMHKDTAQRWSNKKPNTFLSCGHLDFRSAVTAQNGQFMAIFIALLHSYRGEILPCLVLPSCVVVATNTMATNGSDVKYTFSQHPSQTAACKGVAPMFRSLRFTATIVVMWPPLWGISSGFAMEWLGPAPSLWLMTSLNLLVSS